MPGRPEDALEILANTFGAGKAAGHVVAHVDDRRRPRHGGEQRVERGHPVGIRGRDRQPTAGVVERGLADPADPILDRVQHRQQEITPRSGLVAPARRPPVDIDVAHAPVPATESRADLGVKEGVDRRALLWRGDGTNDVEIHGW